jgi:hypothetical protein
MNSRWPEAECLHERERHRPALQAFGGAIHRRATWRCLDCGRTREEDAPSYDSGG